MGARVPQICFRDEIVVPPGRYLHGRQSRSAWTAATGDLWTVSNHGRPFLIYWSVDATSGDYNSESTFWTRLTSVFETLVHCLRGTRWSRILHTVH